MTLTFYFILSFEFWTWLNWILFILILLTYLFLILGSRSLKKHNFASTKLLFIIGILLLIWYVFRQFFPQISLFSPTPMEMIIAYIYSLLLLNGTIYQILNVVLGIGFIKFGSNNRDRGGKLMLIGGIFFLIITIINVTAATFYLTAFWFGFPLPFWFGNYFLNLTSYIVITIAAILIFISSIFTRRPLFIIFGTLFLAFHSIQLLLFIIGIL